MICPRCGNEWDATKSPCTRCGLVIRVPASGPLGRTNAPPESAQRTKTNSQQLAGMPPAQPQTGATSFNNPNAPAPNWSSRPAAGGNGFAPRQTPPQQIPHTPRFFNPPSPTRPVTENTRPPRPAPGGGNNNPVPHPSSSPSLADQAGAGLLRAEGVVTRRVPPRPQNIPLTGMPVTGMLGQNAGPSGGPPHPTTDPLTREQQRAQGLSGPMLQRGAFAAPAAQDAGRTLSAENRQLMPGTLLRGGRYRLQEMQEHQEWLAGAAENMWNAQDAQRGAARVMMRELILPESGSVVMQSTLRTATMALSSVGRHPHIPTLWDAFSDRGRSFFVFEPVDGESLMARMRRTGRAMPEQDVIECCLQMTEILELLAQQSHPLTHGLISPEHIMITRTGSQYVLTNFSVVLAGGATQFISGIDRTRLSVYTAPEFVRGVIEVRCDLFSLMATAYHAVTGSIPAGVSGSIPQAQRLNPNVSQQFDAVLSKGLRPIASQRYQRPSELRQDLLAMRSVSGSLVSNAQRFEAPLIAQPVNSAEKQRTEPAAQGVSDSLAQAFQSLAPSEDLEEQPLLLPRPEELPPMAERNDRLIAFLWLSGILVGLLIIVFMTRGFV
jgi:serine/threonine protein kinase